ETQGEPPPVEPVPPGGQPQANANTQQGGETGRQQVAQPPAGPFLPPRFQAQPGTESVAHKGRSYFKRIGYPAKDGLTAWFVLVPADPATNEPPFYVMQNKVWAGLYTEFSGAGPGGDADRLAPVTRVRFADARR